MLTWAAMFPSNHQPPCLVLLDLQADPQDVVDRLCQAGFDTRCVSSDLPDLLPDVIVTDRADTKGWRVKYAEPLSTGQLGVISVGAPQPADICLPGDVSQRELALAVQLVAQIVGLRRQQWQTRAEQHTWMELALRDALTELPNRHAWQKELPLRLAAQAEVCVALLDVDFFKRINDQEGHHIGDRVLREIAASLRAHLRADDFVARLGGDEFGVVLAGVGEKNAEAIIERVRVSVSQHLAEMALPAATISAGFVCCPPFQPVDNRGAFAAAAAALRQAKCRHRDCCVAYSADGERRDPRSAS